MDFLPQLRELHVGVVGLIHRALRQFRFFQKGVRGHRGVVVVDAKPPHGITQYAPHFLRRRLVPGKILDLDVHLGQPLHQRVVLLLQSVTLQSPLPHRLCRGVQVLLNLQDLHAQRHAAGQDAGIAHLLFIGLMLLAAEPRDRHRAEQGTAQDGSHHRQEEIQHKAVSSAESWSAHPVHSSLSSCPVGVEAGWPHSAARSCQNRAIIFRPTRAGSKASRRRHRRPPHLSPQVDTL